MAWNKINKSAFHYIQITSHNSEAEHTKQNKRKKKRNSSYTINFKVKEKKKMHKPLLRSDCIAKT